MDCVSSCCGKTHSFIHAPKLNQYKSKTNLHWPLQNTSIITIVPLKKHFKYQKLLVKTFLKILYAYTHTYSNTGIPCLTSTACQIVEFEA